MSDHRLRDAALRYLEGREPGIEGGQVRRVTMDVDVDGRVEMVTLSLREGELQCVCSDGNVEGPHVRAALEFAAGMDPGESLASGRMPVHARREDAALEGELADALDDLLTAVTRVGVNRAPNAPSVDEALQRVVSEVPEPTPLGLGRFIGRLKHEIALGRVRRVARMLDGSARLATALRGAPTPNGAARIRAWLGSHAGSQPEIELLSDRVLLEVGREWLAATERASLERRYMVDLRSGKVYREDRPRNASASSGACPRQIGVGLAEVEAGPEPQRLRVLQYEVQPDIPKQSWDRLKQVADRDFASVTQRYRRSIKNYPALSEPFVVVSPYRVERNGGLMTFDLEGHVLGIARSDRRGVVDAFHAMLKDGAELSWVAGRLSDSSGHLRISPFAFGTHETGYRRLR